MVVFFSISLHNFVVFASYKSPICYEKEMPALSQFEASFLHTFFIDK